MDKRKYTSRVTFSDEQQKIILDNYQNMSAGAILKLLQENDPTQQFNDQMIYSFLRRVKREAEKSYQLLLQTNAKEAAENLKTEIASIIPDKRQKNTSVIQQFLNNILEKSGVNPHD